MENIQSNTRLINAIDTLIPRVRDIKKLLTEGANINHKTINGHTPLMIASAKQHDRIVDYLLRQGADPLIKNKEHKIASELISSDASTYLILKDFELISAVLTDNVPAAKALISIGALVNTHGVYGYTPLMIAAEKNNAAMVDFLLLQGADPNLTLKNGQKAFDLTYDKTIHHLLQPEKNENEKIPAPKKSMPHFFSRPTNTHLKHLHLK